MPFGLLVLFVAIATPSPMLVRGEGTCPGADEVSSQLGARLRPLAVNQETAWLERSGASLKIEVRDATGVVLASRDLPAATHSCADLAHAAAVVIAAWMLDLHPELAPLPRPQAPVEETKVSVPAAKTPPVKARRLHSAAGVGVAANADGWTPEGRVALGWAPSARWLLRLSVMGQGRREVNVDPGSARYALATIAPGFEWTAWSTIAFDAAQPQWRLALTGDAHATLIHIEGRGFSRDLSHVSVEPRTAAGLRLARRAGNTEMWVALESRAWLRHQVASVSPNGTEVPLSRWDVSVVAGWAGRELQRKQTAALVYRVLEALPEQQRAALIMFELEGLSGEQIAAVFDKPVANVWVWLHRARARFLVEAQALGLDQEALGISARPMTDVRRKSAS